MPDKPVKTRFAPSPTGEIHLGNLRTALFNALFARSAGGVFLLRIEDTDRLRSKTEYAGQLMDDLHWLGLEWQEGPRAGGGHGPYSQSERLDIYERYYRALEDQGAAYPCFCSDAQLHLARKAQRAAGEPPRYPGTCAHLSAGEVASKLEQGMKPTLRFRVPARESIEFDDRVRGRQTFSTDEIGDFIIRRSDGAASFFFTNAIDDALMGVTLVLRGEDHLTNTPRQLLILRALGLPAPAYGHLSLLVGPDGSPLSKRHGSRSVRELREQGFLPGALLNYLARLGHSFEQDRYGAFDELAAGFAIERLGRAPARFDGKQLLHWQKEAIAASPDGVLLEWFRQSPAFSQAAELVEGERLAELIAVVRENVEMPADVLAWARRLAGDAGAPDDDAQRVMLEAGSDFFRHALQVLDTGPADFRAFAGQVGKSAGVKGKALFMPLRAALTGATHGPEMARVWQWLGEDECRGRLRTAMQNCANGARPNAETV